MIEEDVTLAYQLIKYMNEPLIIDEEEYQKWRQTKKETCPTANRDYVRGSDFKEYWICPRRLHKLVHTPVPQKSRANRSIYEAIQRHENIQAVLREHGWKTEYNIKTKLHGYNYYGHIDGLSCSPLVMDIKNNNPSQGDLLQTGSYSLAHGENAPCIILYRTGFQYYQNLSRLTWKYVPRVLGCLFTDHEPPLHPDFPNCYYNCEYFAECGRARKPPVKTGKTEWADWFRKIGEECQKT